jgi:hypothetical protein
MTAAGFRAAFVWDRGTLMKRKQMNSGKPVLAGVFGTIAVSGLVVGIAWATTGVGISTTILAGPTLLSEINVHSRSETNDVKIKTKGLSNVYTVYNRIVPGGHTGRHSHPAPSIITVKSGQATAYEGGDLSRTPQVFVAGTAFVDDGEHAHIIRNEGITDLELVAFQILPAGAPRRIDEPQPAGYDF